jgi:hypothetical protein
MINSAAGEEAAVQTILGSVAALQMAKAAV